MEVPSEEKANALVCLKLIRPAPAPNSIWPITVPPSKLSVPLDPACDAMFKLAALTVPPSLTVRLLPLPAYPRVRSFAMDQEEPGPVTSTLLLEEAASDPI